jgi:hypothetical protein
VDRIVGPVMVNQLDDLPVRLVFDGPGQVGRGGLRGDPMRRFVPGDVYLGGSGRSRQRKVRQP